MALRISNAHFEALRQHGEETYPHECCGVLVGEARAGGTNSVHAVIPCGNTRTDSPGDRYQIDSRDLVRIQREARVAGREIVGLYHSHPDHPAQCSATDLADAYWVDCSYVITSIQNGKAAVTKSFRLLSDQNTRRFEEEVIQVSAAEEKELLSDDEMLRYARHLSLPEVGMVGQRKLKDARVLCVGAGGLGSPLILYLAAAGVGTIGLVDFDVVDYTNLQRQIIHTTSDVGRLKVDSASEKLLAINPFVKVIRFDTMLTSANAVGILKDFDIIADGTDNFAARYLVNDACVLAGKPDVYASVSRFEGRVTVLATADGPCYRCLYPEPPPPGLLPSCTEGGVLGVLPGMLGVMQATEILKLILGLGEPLIGRLLLVDALGARFRELRVRKNRECPVCGDNPTIRALIDYNQFCGVRGEAMATAIPVPEIQPEELKRRLDAGEDIFVLDVREPHEYQICNLNGLLIPIGDLAKRVGELDSSRDIVVHCRSGGRSAHAVQFLRQAGFQHVTNLAGGILRWAEKVDPTLTRY